MIVAGISILFCSFPKSRIFEGASYVTSLIKIAKKNIIQIV